MKINKVGILVKKISLEFDKRSNPILQEHGITSAQYKILKYLYMHDGEMVRLADLEKQYSLTHPTAIGLLNQLEKKNFIIRTINPEDARSRNIVLSDKALAQREELEAIGDSLEKSLTAALTGEERKELICLLQKIMDSFGT